MVELVDKKKMHATTQLNAAEIEEMNQKIQYDICKIYHYLVKFGVPSNAIAGLAYVFANYNSVNAKSLIGWYSALMIANFINLFRAMHYEDADISTMNLSKARSESIYIISVICLIWGCIGILFFSEDKNQQITTLIFLSGALICFSITTVIDLTIGVICIICIVGPGVLYDLHLIITHHLTSGKINSLNVSFSIAFAVVGFFLMIVCYIGNKVFINVFRLGYINKLLSQKLENINFSLEHRIKDRTKELQHLYSLSQATLEATHEGILAVSIKGTVLTYNNKFLNQWGITEDFLLSNTIDDIFNALADKVDNPKNFLLAVKKLKHTKPNKNSRIIEFRLKSGIVLEYHTHSQALHHKQIGMVHSFQDITERNRMRMQASLQDRLATTGRLVANVAHEINNPVAWILSNLQLIKSKFSVILRDKDPNVNGGSKPRIYGAGLNRPKLANNAHPGRVCF